MRWGYFAGAAVLVGYGMLTAGAPLATVIAGIGIAAFLNLGQLRKSAKAAPFRKI